jgi:hypothetical protein
MLKCYLFALCAGSSLEKDTNCLTLFRLIEGVTTTAEGLGQPVPIEVHAYFWVESGANDASFEMRVIRIASDGSEDAGSGLAFRTEAGPRMRVRIGALRLPKAFGLYTLRLEWRPTGTETWHPEPLRWPLDLTEAALPSAALVVAMPDAP